MELIKSEFIKLFEKQFKASYREAGRQLNVAPEQVYRIVNGTSKAGAKFFGKLISYCDTHNLNFRRYIFLPELLTTINSK